MAKTLKPGVKRNKKALKTEMVAEFVKPQPTPVAVDHIALLAGPQAPLAKRCEVRALACKQALEDVIIRLKTYQNPGAANDFNDFLEVTLRTSLETIAQIILKLNVPAAYFPEQAENLRKERERARNEEAASILQEMNRQQGRK